MKMKKRIVSIILLQALLFPLACFSQDQSRSGLSSEFTAGVIFIDVADNLNPSGSKSSIASLESGPKRHLTTLPILLPEITYRFGGGNRFAWYFNTKSPLDEAGNFALSSGFSCHLPDLAAFDAGVFYVPFAEVWKNPYLLGEPRQETDVTPWGAQFTASRIADSELRVKVAYLREDVDRDDLAILFPDLARDGEIYHLAVSYGLFDKSVFPLRPQLSVSRGEYDGDSSSFTRGKAEITGRYMTGRYFFMPGVHYSYKEHDEKDPVFSSTRSEKGYGFNLIVKYGGLFDIKALGLLAIAGYGRGQANESFYDTESLVCGLGLSYAF